MPSSQQPPITPKPRGAFLRKKMAEFVNPSLKTGSKISSSIPKSRSSTPLNESTDQPRNNTSTDSVAAIEKTNENVVLIEDGCNNGSNPPTVITAINKVDGTKIQNSNPTISNDKNDDHVAFDPVFTTSEQVSSLSSNQNNFGASSRMTNESSSSSSTSCSGEATFTTTSSSHQRLHRQITRTSEMKTSCVKSDLSELKSSLSEMKNLNFTNSTFRKSFENIVDSKESVGLENSNSMTSINGEPMITYPESPTPSQASIISFPSEVSGSRKNSLATEELHCSSPSTTMNSELKFEQKRSSSAASKTKMITEQFKSEESIHASDQFAFQKHLSNSALQTNNIIAKTLDSRHEQRTLTSENVTHQQSQNISSSTMRLQSDSFSAEKVQKALAAQQQRQITSSSSATGLYNQEKVIAQHSNFSSSKGFSSSVSHMEKYNSNFVKNEVDEAMSLVRQSSVSEYLNETFDDLNKLQTNASQQEVEKAISKYSDRLRQIVGILKDSKLKTGKVPTVLNKLSEMMSKAWLVPTHGYELGNVLCNELRKSGGLDLLISNCDSTDEGVKFSSAKLLEQCLTTDNRAYVVENGLEKVVRVACAGTKKNADCSRISTGLLEHLFKHCEGTCESVIRLGGLDAVLFECRKNDVETLRHCASALANLSLYGGAENQVAMIKRKVPMWLFPLAFHTDDNVKYYACLAIAALVANKEIEAEVLKSGTLNLVEPFVTTHNPSEFAKSNLSHAHGQSQNWLRRLVPVLSSKREEARNLAAFHFCMEAGIKKSQNNTKIFHEIGAIESLKNVASCPNAIASKFAAQALRLIGEDIPHQLIQQVPLWSVEDVKQWVIQIGFAEYCNNFEQSRVDGDLLLQLTEENLREDIGITNGIRRRRFARELHTLKKMADYSSRDTDNLNNFLQNVGPEFSIYTYSMLNAGVDRDYLKSLSQEQLVNECGITNSIHRIRILESIKKDNNLTNTFQENSEKPLDVFISYRRSNGSQLASLLKVHLQVRNFSVFIDVEKLEAGKFDNNLLQSIKQARNFILVLTPNALDRCINDIECKDWVHREIVAALQSGCNIIPITDNFQWPEPEDLPEDMRPICHFNGIRWIHDYQDACVEKLERFIRGEVSSRSLNQDLSFTVPHGARHQKTDTTLKSPPSYQRTQSVENSREGDTCGE